MTEDEKVIFHSRINFIPPWVRTQNDLEKFARHLNFRLMQKQAELDSVYSYLQMFHIEIFNKVVDEEADLVQKHSQELSSEYDDVYNSNATMDDINF